jgi:hypothetical protein
VLEHLKVKSLFPPNESKLISILQPGHDEIVVDKRVQPSARSGALCSTLRIGLITNTNLEVQNKKGGV